MQLMQFLTKGGTQFVMFVFSYFHGEIIFWGSKFENLITSAIITDFLSIDKHYQLAEH